jgi:hypothetical protein
MRRWAARGDPLCTARDRPHPHPTGRPDQTRSAYASDQDWRDHLEHELEAAQGRGDQETLELVARELERLGSR